MLLSFAMKTPQTINQTYRYFLERSISCLDFLKIIKQINEHIDNQKADINHFLSIFKTNNYPNNID